MARTYMRNKTSGEIRDVETDSQEFRDLQREVTPQGLSMWEQTSYPHAEAVKERAAYGELLDEDLGHDDQRELLPMALALDLEGVAPERNPHLYLTPGEVEQGITPQSKLEDLREEYNSRIAGSRAKVFERAADLIADERKQRESGAPEEYDMSARAGGSDDREDAPAPGSGGPRASGGGSPQAKKTPATSGAPASGGSSSGGSGSPAGGSGTSGGE